MVKMETICKLGFPTLLGRVRRVGTIPTLTGLSSQMASLRCATPNWTKGPVGQEDLKFRPPPPPKKIKKILTQSIYPSIY